jgi:hypothetical protein
LEAKMAGRQVELVSVSEVTRGVLLRSYIP